MVNGEGMTRARINSLVMMVLLMLLAGSLLWAAEPEPEWRVGTLFTQPWCVNCHPILNYCEKNPGHVPVRFVEKVDTGYDGADGIRHTFLSFPTAMWTDGKGRWFLYPPLTGPRPVDNTPGKSGPDKWLDGFREAYRKSGAPGRITL